MCNKAPHNISGHSGGYSGGYSGGGGPNYLTLAVNHLENIDKSLSNICSLLEKLCSSRDTENKEE